MPTTTTIATTSTTTTLTTSYATTATRWPSFVPCDEYATSDVVFVLSSNQLLGADHWSQTLQFVTNVVELLDVGENATR